LAGLRKTIQAICLFTLCLVTSGLQWDLLQVVAWSRMLADNSQSMSFARAVEKTFNGDMCPLCRVVDHAKQQQARNPAAAVRTDSKLILFCHTVSVVVLPGPRATRTWPADAPAPGEIRRTPPVPPPRLAAA
jgi:hypothetical protein